MALASRLAAIAVSSLAIGWLARELCALLSGGAAAFDSLMRMPGKRRPFCSSRIPSLPQARYPIG
jgi:hypothetical protein